ncbi:hypothetical protein IEQ34_000237 [Dendrobium chrysotoxum]|uniref:Uncharacterized protein n=1 Tax=Dendrobium chrysotoxum TaxID=161865 RepID=A0AAV7HQN1_DENCH|nr:hypothetical protein IEQ34_000237 [Dendrobium chrysotoxum]
MALMKKLKKAKRKLKDSSKCRNTSSAPKPPKSQQVDSNWWYSFWHKNSDSGGDPPPKEEFLGYVWAASCASSRFVSVTASPPPCRRHKNS